MRKIISLFVATFLVGGAAATTRAAESVSIDFFYNALEPQGEWIDAADYGYVWHPNGVAEDWRPYTDGRWVYTDAGWTWDSDEPYGWAVYHYGRWARLESAGWVWVPDVEWGPAWVSWRRSEKHIGWAPLPPEARFQRTVGIQKWADSYYDIGPSNYTFVETRRFGARRLREVIVEPRQNVTIITQTTNITNITYRGDYIVNEGPQYDVVVRESAEPIQRLRIERRTDVVYDPEGIRGDRYRNRVQGGSFQIIAPTIQAVATAAPHRVARTVQQVNVNRGWTDAGDQRQVEQLRTKMKAEAKAPPELPPQPKFDRKALAAGAKEAGTAPTAAAAPTAPTPATAGKMKPGEQPAATATAPATPTATAETPPAPAATPKDGKPGAKGRAAAAAAAASGTPATGATPATPTATPRNAKNRKGAPTAPPTSTTPATAPETADAKPDAKMKPTATPEAAKPATETPDATGKPEPTKPSTRKRGANAPGAEKPPTEPSSSEPAAPSTPATKPKRGPSAVESQPGAEAGKPMPESAKPRRSEAREPSTPAEPPAAKKNSAPAHERPGNAPGADPASSAHGAGADRSPAARSAGAERPGNRRETAPPSASGASSPAASHGPSPAAGGNPPSTPGKPDGKGKEKGKGKSPNETTEPAAPAPGQ